MNIVLAHGFFGFREVFGIEYFQAVKEALLAKFNHLPIHVLVSVVDPLGRVKQRGRELANQIDNELKPGGLDPAQPIHIIAHSMGGLDARYCISSRYNARVAEQITSLTTIGTPHWGSPVADFLTAGGRIDELERESPLVGNGLLAKSRLRELIDGVDLIAGGMNDLTSAAAKDFNLKYTDAPKVRYFSYAGRGRDNIFPTSITLLLTHAFIWLTGARQNDALVSNDGLVSVDSATWGELLDVWPADHADEIGHDLDRGFAAPSTAIDHLKKYEEIVNMLIARGLAGPVKALQG